MLVSAHELLSSALPVWAEEGRAILKDNVIHCYVSHVTDAALCSKDNLKEGREGGRSGGERKRGREENQFQLGCLSYAKLGATTKYKT